MHLIDRLLRLLIQAGSYVVQWSPFTQLLAPVRAEAVEHVIQQLAPGPQQAEQALAELQREVARRCAHRGVMHRLACRADRAWHRPELTEYMDDPELDRGRRRGILRCLDAFNELAGSYQAFFDALRPLMLSGRPTRVLDLASGHGGFMLWCARQAQREGLDLTLTASDIRQEYLDLGAQQAADQGLAVTFVKQDAMDLSASDGQYDVITSTQALHHFPAQMTATMLHEAARSATRGVLFVDGSRSPLAAAVLLAVSLLRYGNADFAHDSIVSTRRFPVAQELALLARLSPHAAGAEASWGPPGHCFLRLLKA